MAMTRASFSRSRAWTFLRPRPPAPTRAMFTFSLGGTNPGPPSTCRGTIEIPAKAVAAEPSNSLRVMLLGALGSLVYVLRSYVHHRGMGTFAMGWTWWYILRALSGAGLAVIVYLALRGGLLATSASASELNKFGLGGAAALSGLFANDAIELLSRQFSTLLGSGSPSGNGGGDDEGGADGRDNPDESSRKEQPHDDGDSKS